MKMTLIILLTMFFTLLSAPPSGSGVVFEAEVARPYEAIIYAIATIESSNGKYMLNEKEMAVGYFGIRPIRLEDYNKRTGDNITLDQCYDYETGKKILLYYISKIDHRDIKAIAISWNGVSKENKYFAKLQKTLLSL